MEFTFLVDQCHRKFAVTCDPQQAVDEHFTVGERLCSGRLEVCCLHCEEWIQLPGAQYRFHPVTGTDNQPRIEIRPGTRTPKTCSHACRQAASEKIQQMPAIVAHGGGKSSAAAGSRWDNDIAIYDDRKDISHYIEHQISIAD